MGTDGPGDQPTQGWDRQNQFFGGPAHPADQFAQPDQPGQSSRSGSAGAPGAFGADPFGQQPGWQPPYDQPGPYGQPGAGWPMMAHRPTNSLAIAALCCGVAQVVAGPFAGIPAIILGAMSLRQIRLSGEDGRGLAATGLALGLAGTILSVLAVIFVVLIINRVAPSQSFP